MNRLAHPVAALLAVLVATPAVAGWSWEGRKQIVLHTRDGQTLPIGSVRFEPHGDGQRFTLDLEAERFHEFFLSMKEFKCLEGPEITCHVPYPYANPHTVTAQDLSWLSTGLIFFFKAPADYGAKLTNGLYFPLHVSGDALVGTPESVDLNAIAAPPPDLKIPPFPATERSEIEPGARWIRDITIADPAAKP